MTVMFITYFFPPLGGGGVQRVLKLVKYLQPLGVESVVVTVKPGGYWVEDCSLAEEIPDRLELIRTSSGGLPAIFERLRRARKPGRAGVRSSSLFASLRSLSSLVLIPDQFVGWAPFAYRAARKRIAEGGIDVVVTSSSPDSSHLVGLALKRRTRIPWIADFRDPWTRRISFSAPTRAHEKLHRYLELEVLRGADRIVCTSGKTMEDFIRRYPEVGAGKYHLVYNGYDPEDFAAVEPARPAGPGGFVLLHAGLLSHRRTLGPFLEGLKELLRRGREWTRELKAVFIGPVESANIGMVKRAGLEDHVEFAGPLPHREAIGRMLGADCLVLIEAPGSRGGLIIPGKTFEYLACRKPILALVPEGAASELIRELGAGVAVTDGDPGSIASAIERIHDGGAGVFSPREDLVEEFTRRAQAERFAAVLGSLRKGEDPGE